MARHAVMPWSDLTGYLPLQTDLSWDVVSPVEYLAGTELICSVTMANPGAAERALYVIGALYTVTAEGGIGDLIAGSEFGVYQADGTTHGVNSAEWMTVWGIPAAQQKVWQCRFTLGATDCFLGLVMVEMVGATPAVDDVVRGGVTALLSAPEAELGGMLESILPLVVLMMIMGMMMPMMKGITGPSKK